MLARGTSPPFDQFHSKPVGVLAGTAGSDRRRHHRLPGPAHGSGGPTRLSAQTRLSVKSGLPRKWRSGAKFANSPASAYLD